MQSYEDNNKREALVSINNTICNNSSIIFMLITYLIGLIIGSISYKYLNFDLINPIFEEILKGSGKEFLTCFINNLILSFTLFLLIIGLGFNIIGFPFVNLITLLSGMIVSLKLSYFYVSYGPKGIGYSLLLLIPGIVFMMTILILASELSSNLSKNIYNSTIKKSDTIEEINLKSYLIKFIIYSVLLIVISALNALIYYLLEPLITL